MPDDPDVARRDESEELTTRPDPMPKREVPSPDERRAEPGEREERA